MRSVQFLLIIFAVPQILGQLEKCFEGDDWYRFNSNCYKFVQLNNHVSWAGAEDYCAKLGGHLVSIENEEENKFILNEFKNQKTTSFRSISWIGLKIIGFDSSFKWSDGTIFDYNNWRFQMKPILIRQSSCVVLFENGEWSPTDCDIMLDNLVCKIKNTTDETTLPSIITEGNCPESWLKFKNKCYKIYGDGEETYFVKAKKQCRNTNSNLVSIHTKEQQDFLTSIIVGLNTSLWTDLTIDTLNHKIHKWGGQTKLDFENWALGEPKNTNDMHHVCINVQMHHELNLAGKWSVRTGCSVLNGYICEKDIDPAIPPPKQQASNCPDGYVRYRRSCFKIELTKFDWINAEEECQENHGHLVTINDRFDQAFLGVLTSQHLEVKPDIWIGFAQGMTPESNGSFSWIDGWPTYYTNWDINEPSRANYTKRCVAMNNDTRWSVVDCSTKLGFICRINDDEPPAVSKSSVSCPKSNVKGREWVDLGSDYCYHLEQRKGGSTWQDALNTCSEMGNDAKLASFHNQHELDLLRSQIKEINIGSTPNLWIGLVQNLFGGYTWIDNSPVNFAPWSIGNPQNSIFFGCVHLKPHTMTFENDHCGLNEGFICEVKKENLAHSRQNGKENIEFELNNSAVKNEKESGLNINTDGYHMGVGAITAIVLFVIISVILATGLTYLFVRRKTMFPRYFNNDLYEEVNKLEMEFT